MEKLFSKVFSTCKAQPILEGRETTKSKELGVKPRDWQGIETPEILNPRN
ncbi:uncharacterized protein G2W53_044469 [Senna tora]|uniref:Uncharacterized protein n=1 Tax=Senna tora TaxID=362788 RepID=A0A834SC04_9FABA|nr:uncharacterized protein G2W53_044469 [Senna tora]